MTAGHSGHGSKRKNHKAAVAERAALVDANGAPVTKAPPRILTPEELALAEQWAQATIARAQAEATIKATNQLLRELTQKINGTTKESMKRAGVIFAEARDLIVKTLSAQRPA